jgi:uncharacterized protein (TIGR00251 family)
MITSTPGGIVIDVRVTPRASRSGIDGTHDGALRVRLNAPPVDGAANDALITLMADVLDVPKRAVTIVGGQTSRTKRVRVDGISADAAQQRIAAASRPKNA